MSSRYIANYNPILFLQEFEEAVNDGFYADNSVIGYPQLGPLNEINVFQIDKPEARNTVLDSSTLTLVIESYDNVGFILDVQDAILQGFYIDVQTVALGVNYTPHTVTLYKAVQGVLNVQAVRQDTPATVNASQSTTEAPVSPKAATQTTKQRKTTKGA